MELIAKFLALVERIADALEVIAAAKSGNDAPRVAPAAEAATEKAVDKKAEAKAAKEAKEKAAAEKKAADEAKAAKAKAAEADPLGDPLEGGDEPVKEYTDKEVKDMLAKVIDQDGRNAAFAILKEKGGGAKSFTDLKKEHYEDVYVACQDKLG